MIIPFSLIWAFVGFFYVTAGSSFGYAYILTPQQVTIIASVWPIVFMGNILGILLRNERLQFLTVIGCIFLFVVIPTVLGIYNRRTTQPYLFVHDNPIQIEEAIEFIFDGNNPYGQDYSPTILSQWPYDPGAYSYSNLPASEGFRKNPSLSHVVSLSFGIVGMIPFYFLWDILFGWFDARIGYGALYLATVAIGYQLVEKEKRLPFLSLFALNPFFALFIPEGRNDVMTVFLLILSLYYAIKKRYFLSAVPLGLAVATKQSAWIYAIVFFIYLFFKERDQRGSLLWKYVCIVFLTAFCISAPFIIANPNAFLRDTVFYVSGGIESAYPIRGFGFSSLLLALGMLPHAQSGYPAALLQLIAIIPIGFFVLRLLRKNPTERMLLIGYCTLLLTVLYFSRFFMENYLGVVVQFLILSFFIQADTISTHQAHRK